MKYLKLLIVLMVMVWFIGCRPTKSTDNRNTMESINNDLTTESLVSITEESQSTGLIYLYGEFHDVELILEKELELWHDYYHNESMRHLFIETPYYTAELLNLWMPSDDDVIFDEIYNDWAGSAAQNPLVKEFYETIKSEYPETIFHGTDVGHQSETTGMRYLAYLIMNDLKDTKEYRLTVENINQGKYFYENVDYVYRENVMVENVIREFDELKDENVMGIYGGAHVGLEALDFTQSVRSMANQLKKRYGDNIYSEYVSKYIEPERVDTIQVNGKDYQALYFGKGYMSWDKDYDFREFWRLEDAYDIFKDHSIKNNVLPYSNYPMLIETGQVFVIDFTKLDGSVVREYYRSDGTKWKDRPTTLEFTVEQ